MMQELRRVKPLLARGLELESYKCSLFMAENNPFEASFSSSRLWPIIDWLYPTVDHENLNRFTSDDAGVRESAAIISPRPRARIIQMLFMAENNPFEALSSSCVTLIACCSPWWWQALLHNEPGGWCRQAEAALRKHALLTQANSTPQLGTTSKCHRWKIPNYSGQLWKGKSRDSMISVRNCQELLMKL